MVQFIGVLLDYTVFNRLSTYGNRWCCGHVVFYKVNIQTLQYHYERIMPDLTIIKYSINFRNKSKIDSPIATSFKNLYRYHMGTVALGSLLISIVKIIRELLRVSSHSFSTIKFFRMKNYSNFL